MSTPAERLRPGASDEEVKKAISETIAMLVEEGQEQQQAIAIAHEQARQATGRDKKAIALSSDTGRRL